MDFFNGLSQVDYMTGISSLNYLQNLNKTDPAEKQFATIFFSEMMKQVFISQNTLFNSGDEQGYFSGYTSMTDIFVQRMVEKVVSSGGNAR